MTAHFRSRWKNISGSRWFVPGLCILFSTEAALVLPDLNRNIHLSSLRQGMTPPAGRRQSCWDPVSNPTASAPPKASSNAERGLILGGGTDLTPRASEIAGSSA